MPRNTVSRKKGKASATEYEDVCTLVSDLLEDDNFRRFCLQHIRLRRESKLAEQRYRRAYRMLTNEQRALLNGGTGNE